MGEDANGPLTIGQILKKHGVTSLANTKTPDGKDINTYRVNSYIISSSSIYITANETKKKLVFDSNSYWLASTYVYLHSDFRSAYFYVRFVNEQSTDGNYGTFTFGSYGDSYSCEKAVRPIIALNGNVKLAKQSDGSWSI